MKLATKLMVTKPEVNPFISGLGCVVKQSVCDALFRLGQYQKLFEKQTSMVQQQSQN